MEPIALSLPHKLDAIDWMIVDHLQLDGRLSYSELGRRIGLSQPATTERVRRLEECGVITGYRAVVDAGSVGLPITVLIRIAPLGEQAWGAARDAHRFPEVVECHRVTGDDSYVMRAVVASVEHLQELNDRLSRYGRLTTSVVLSTPIRDRPISREAAEGCDEGRRREGASR